MQLEEFLEMKGTDLSRVIAKAQASLGLQANEGLFAVGSLVEGLGNAKSDVDLLWVTPLDQRSIPSAEEMTWILGRCIVDVQAVEQTILDELLARLDVWSRIPWGVSHPAKFSYEERKILHRLLNARPLHANTKRDFSRLIPSAANLARLKLHVARQESRTIQVDMVGYRDTRDFGSLVYAAQDLLDLAVDALLAGHGFTNPIPKWRNRLLDQVPSDWEHSMPIRPTGLKAREVVWRLHRAPAQPDEGPSLDHAFRIATFARAVFAWAELRFLNNSSSTQEPLKLSSFSPTADSSALPFLDLDLDFCFAEGSVALGRLNEFAETIQMSQREFVLALLFDGTTTPKEAELAVFGSENSREGARILKQLVSRLKRAGLSVHSNRVGIAGSDRRSKSSASI